MTTVTWALVATMLSVAGFCASRIVVARRTGRPAELDSDALHVAMGIAMAGMLATSLRIAPLAPLRSVPDPLWIGVFLLGAAWFGWQVVRPVLSRQPAGQPAGQHVGRLCPQPAPHLLKCAAMVYMVVAVRKTAAPMSMGTSSGRLSFVPLLFALFLIVYVVRLADRPVLAGNLAGNGVLAPRCATACKLAMGVTMSYMLVMML
jgi:hypothetical protein